MLRERLEPGIKLWYFEGLGMREKTKNVNHCITNVLEQEQSTEVGDIKEEVNIRS